MKTRHITILALVPALLLFTLTGCDSTGATAITDTPAPSGGSGNADNPEKDTKNSSGRGGKTTTENPSSVNPISDGSGGGTSPSDTTPPSPPAAPPSSSSPFSWSGGGPTPDVYNAASSYSENDIVYIDGKYYKAKPGTVDPSPRPNPLDQGNNGTNWKRVNPDGSDYLRTGQDNATPYDSKTTYNDPAPSAGRHYYVTHNGKLWKANTTGCTSPGGCQFSGLTISGLTTAPGDGTGHWAEVFVLGAPAPVTLKDSFGNTLGTIDTINTTTTSKRVLTIPPSTKIIRDNAFKNKNLNEVRIPTGVTAIGKSAFEGNTGLTTVTIPDTVTHIKESAFRGTNLTSVTIPTSVTSIGDGAFMEAELSSGSVTFSSPSSITSIGNDAFRGTDLTSVTIPTSVTSIGNGAFRGTSLTEVTFAPTSSVTSIGNDAFRGTELASVTIPTSVTSIGNGAFRGTSLTTVTIPNSVTSIGNGAFRGTSLTTVTIPNSVTRIENGTFRGTALTTVTIPNSVTRIGNDAFRGTALTTVTIPTSVTSIGTGAFVGIPLLTSVTISQSLLTDVRTSAFPSPTTITFQDHNGITIP